MLKDVEVVDIDSSGNHTEEIVNMLGTIRLPKNLRLLSERLPKSNYGSNAIQSAKKKKSEQKLLEPVTAPAGSTRGGSVIENGPKDL
jgi:hypothetical protein